MNWKHRRKKLGKVELMQEKITEQRKLPNDIKEKLNIITFANLLISIAFMIYMIAVNLLFINEPENIFSNSIKVSSFIFAVLDIILFEISYRKENVRLAVHAIELLCISLFGLAIPYIYFYLNPIIVNIIMLSSIFFSIYYIGKVILIHILEKNKYINNLSDVLEILQEEENDSYLDNYENSEKIEANQNINISEQEVIDGINDIKKQLSKEKKQVAHKKSIQKGE